MMIPARVLGRSGALACLALLLVSAMGQAQRSMVNFAHLDHLSEQKVVNGVPVTCIHVYANYPDYHWVSAAESGPEGVACVDDAARAAVLCMRAYELRNDPALLTRARGYLRFVQALQAPDGMFYNFIFADGTINTTGKTSFKSFGWWAARGMWALATGARVFQRTDAAFADSLLHQVELGLPHVVALVQSTEKVKTIDKYRVPLWLLYDSGADVTSELMLGLTAYSRIRKDTLSKSLITRLGEGLMVMQDGNAETFPYGLHRSWETMWHMWGNSQSCALTEAGQLLRNRTMIASAEREAKGFYTRLLIKGFLKEMDVTKPDSIVEFEQIAYAVRPMTLGLLRLHEATRKREYAVMAGLAASWLTGNNVTGKPMYDPETGRGYDGIRDSSTINLNSGAESTVEALLSLLEAEAVPDAARYLQYRRVDRGESDDLLWGLFRAQGSPDLVLALEKHPGTVRTYEGKAASSFLLKHGNGR